MYCLDTNTNPRIAELIDLLRETSRATRPEQLMAPMGKAVRRWVDSDLLISASRRGLSNGQYKITRMVDFTDPEAENADINPWRDWDSLPTHIGGFIGDVMSKDVPEVIHDLNLIGDPILGDALDDLYSCVAIPVFDEGEAINWAFNFRKDPRGFTADDLELMMSLLNIFGRATKNLIVAREVERLANRVKGELQKVADIQKALLPQSIPDIPGLSISTYYRPCELAGGDYYDFTALDLDEQGQPTPDSRWGIIIADVSGHGASAAVIVAMMQAIVHAYPEHGRACPNDLLEHLNAQLVRKRLDHSFVTAFCGSFDPKDRSFTYACAGHYPPRLKKPGGGNVVTSLPVESGIPLGITDQCGATVHCIKLEPGDTLVLFTDGINESFNRQNEMFGLEKLDETMHRCSGEPSCVISSVTKALEIHEGGMRPTDDQTIVALQLDM